MRIGSKIGILVGMVGLGMFAVGLHAATDTGSQSNRQNKMTTPSEKPVYPGGIKNENAPGARDPDRIGIQVRPGDLVPHNSYGSNTRPSSQSTGQVSGQSTNRSENRSSDMNQSTNQSTGQSETNRSGQASERSPMAHHKSHKTTSTTGGGMGHSRHPGSTSGGANNPGSGSNSGTSGE